MVERIGKISLKFQLLILITLSALIIIILQVIYLSWFQSINKSNHSVMLKDTIKQLELKAVTFSDDITNIANLISFNDVAFKFINAQDIGDQLILSRNMELMIESTILANESIQDIIVTDLNLIHIGVNKQENFFVINKIKAMIDSGEIQFNRAAHYVLKDQASEQPIYVCIAKSYASHKTERQFITIVIYNVDTFINTVSSFQPDDYSLFVIMDSKSNIVASNHRSTETSQSDLIAALIREQAAKPASNSVETDAQHKSLLYHTSIQNLNWDIVGFTPDSGINKDLSPLKQFAISMGGIVIFVLFACGFFINKSITSPIINIARFMNSVGQNYSTRRMEITHANEISLLAKVLNKMLDSIDEMNQKVIASQEQLFKAQLAKKQAQFSAFQSQINPHFLYNTLDCIRSIAAAKEVPEIFEMTTSMSKIFRYSIKSKDYVKVSEELGCIRDYFTIIQIRHQNRFTITYEVDSAVQDCLIPKMILQPIVENAVFHGLEQKRGRGELTLRGYVTDDPLIVFEIEDDGKGMSPEILQRLREHIHSGEANAADGTLDKKSLGLVNIDRRVKLLYGTNYGLSIESEPQAGTKVIIKLPERLKPMFPEQTAMNN